MGVVAFAGHQLSRECDATWFLLASVLFCICVRYDCYPGIDRLALREYKERASCTALSYQFHRVADRFRAFTHELSAGAILVRHLWERSMGPPRCGRSQLRATASSSFPRQLTQTGEMHG